MRRLITRPSSGGARSAAQRASPNKPARKRGLRRRDIQAWLKPILTAAGLLALVMPVAGGYWASQNGMVDDALAAMERGLLSASAEIGFRVQDVLVEGRVQTPRGQLLAALGVERGTPMLAFDPRAARVRVESLGWVAEAKVERRLPGTIFIRISERQPVAIWQHDGQFLLVDREGVTIGQHKIAGFSHLKLVVGEDAPQHAAALLEVLRSEPALMARVVAAVRVGDRRWNLRLDNGIDVRLPEQRAESAWRRLAALEREHGLLDRDILSVDLRIPDRLVVRRNPEDAAEDHRT